jgi:hypothetical protein
MDEIETRQKGTMVLASLPDKKGADQEEIRYVNILAYHNIGAYIEGRINELKVLANPAPELSEEEKKKKEEMDSTV